MGFTGHRKRFYRGKKGAGRTEANVSLRKVCQKTVNPADFIHVSSFENKWTGGFLRKGIPPEEE